MSDGAVSDLAGLVYAIARDGMAGAPDVRARISEHFTDEVVGDLLLQEMSSRGFDEGDARDILSRLAMRRGGLLEGERIVARQAIGAVVSRLLTF